MSENGLNGRCPKCGDIVHPGECVYKKPMSKPEESIGAVDGDKLIKELLAADDRSHNIIEKSVLHGIVCEIKAGKFLSLAEKPKSEEKCQKCGENCHGELECRDIQKFKSSTLPAKTKWKPDDRITPREDRGDGAYSYPAAFRFKDLSPEVQAALNGEERYKKMWEELKDWFERWSYDTTKGLTIEQVLAQLCDDLATKMSELESSQEGL